MTSLGEHQTCGSTRGSKEVWLCVGFDVKQQSDQLRWLPQFDPSLGRYVPPGGLYQWIGPSAGRIVLRPCEPFKVLVISMYKANVAEECHRDYALAVKNCTLRILPMPDPREDSSSIEIKSWEDLGGQDAEEVVWMLRKQAAETKVNLPLNQKLIISKHAQSVGAKRGVWRFSMELTVEVTIGDHVPETRCFHFDPECQVGTGT